MRAFFLALSLILLPLAGCGQKGPLYLPDEEQEMNQLRVEPIAQ